MLSFSPVMFDSYYTPWKLRQFSNMFYGGGVFSYPTESVYGLGCDPWNADAVSELLTLKRRNPSKGLILLASSENQLAPFVSLRRESDLKKIRSTGNKPVTWLVPVSEETPWWISGNHASVAVRITEFEPVVQLCNSVDSALVSTSANLGGRPACRNSVSVRQLFENQLDMLLSGPTGGVPMPSEIRDFYSNKVVRPSR